MMQTVKPLFVKVGIQMFQTPKWEDERMVLFSYSFMYAQRLNTIFIFA